MTCKVYCPTDPVQDIGVVPEEGYNPYFFPAEGAYLPFFFTDETFVKVLSSLVNGAAITYGDGGRAVVWEFLRNVEFPVNMCQIIADCISDPESPAYAAVRDLVLNDPDINDYILQTAGSVTAAQITSPVVGNGCDNSAVAGAVIAIVERMNDINVDALEIIEVGTNDEEKVSAVLEGIPIFGELPIGDILDFAQDLLEDFFENYNASVTSEWKDSVSEDLYCLAKESPTCELTFEQLFEYFQNRAASGLNLFSTIYDIVSFVVNGDFGTDELIASGMYAVQISLILRGSEFFGMTVPKMSAFTRDALPSTRWEEWDECGEPPPVEDCYDFAASEQSFIPYSNGIVEYATYSAGNGFGVGFNPGIIKIRRASMGGTVVRIEVTFSDPVPSGVNSVLTASNYDGTSPVAFNDPDTEMVEITGLSLASGLDIDLTFDGTLPAGFYMILTCVELAP